MGQFLDPNFSGAPFRLFYPPHLAVLGVVVLVNLFFFFLRRRLSARARAVFRYGMAGLLVVNEILWHTWVAVTGQWSAQSMLPLHLSGLLVWVSAAMLITKNYTVYEFTYFLGIGSSIQTLLTPTLGPYGFPHYRFFEIFISHGTIFTAGVFMSVVEGYRPYWKSVLKVLVGTNIYMAFVGLINWLLDSNYLYICYKPDTASLLDFLGPWPWYILGMEAVGLLTCLILYLPFALRDWRKPRPGQ